MVGTVSARGWIAAIPLAAVAVAMRVYNDFRYPPDWGFDASFNWRYIYRLSRDWTLPDPSAGWSTADPPFFFAVSALLMNALGFVIVAVPLFNTVAGLAVVALAVALVRRVAPGDQLRALLAGGLLLFLPAHIQMSTMVNEEMLAALCASLALFALTGREQAPGRGLQRAAGAGLAAGLALLTKLSGAVAVATTALTYALDARVEGRLRSASLCAVTALLVAALSGGWYYARNQILYGYVQPFGLPAHAEMFEMPPGERGVLDYVRVPLSTFTDPQLLDEDLLHSVWGSTYATVWFDGHRFFLPRDSEGVRRLGTATLLLALLPTAAFALGVTGGLRRWLRGGGGADAPLLLYTGLSLAGFAAYTWRNPWFVVVKGTALLGLSLPFAFYASEVLARWTRGRAAPAVWLLLSALVVCVIASCTFGWMFPKEEVSGLPWSAPNGGGAP